MPAPQLHLTFGELVAHHPAIAPAMRAAVAREPVYTHLGSVFHDITQGDNTLRLDVGGQVLAVPGYEAGPGWDPVTGLGSPDAANLVATLPRYQRPTDGAGL